MAGLDGSRRHTIHMLDQATVYPLSTLSSDTNVVLLQNGIAKTQGQRALLIDIQGRKKSPAGL